MRVMDSTSKRVGEDSCRNVTPNVVVCVSGRSTAMMRLMVVLTNWVMVTPLGSAVREKLTVAFERGEVRRKRVDAAQNEYTGIDLNNYYKFVMHLEKSRTSGV